MWEYNYSNSLTHYGVPGMKWGKRKARYEGVSTDGSKRRAMESARQKMAAARSDKRAANKAYNKSFNRAYNRSSNGYASLVSKKRREDNDIHWEDAFNKADKKYKANKKYKAAKKAYKAAKKAANVEAKAVKTKYREQYMKGASTAGKIYAKLTNADKYYAESMYSLNNGRYKKN